MIEIKFRAWNEAKKEWYYQDDLIITSYGVFEGYHTLSENKPIESALLVQYTGLTDKNGLEIYDGDILKFEHLCNCANELQVVSMDKFMWGTDEYGFQEMIERNYKFEVIGNKYEHSHLLNM